MTLLTPDSLASKGLGFYMEQDDHNAEYGRRYRDKLQGKDPNWRLIDAVDRLAPPPCDSCPLFFTCGSRDLACYAFADYVEGREPRDYPRLPTRKLFKRVFQY